MDEIRQGPRDDCRSYPKPPRWVTAAAVAVVVAVATVLAVTRGGEQHQAAAAPPSLARSASPAVSAAGRVVPMPMPLPVGSGVPIMVIAGWQNASQQEVVNAATGQRIGQIGTLGCQVSVWRKLDPDWRTGSLRAGPLWFVGGRRLGYVHLGRDATAAGTADGHATSSRELDVLMHLDPGANAMMRVNAGAAAHFKFLDKQFAGDMGLILSACPVSDGVAGFTDFYQLQFSIAAGHTASVELWTSTSARPVWVTFSG